MGQCNHSRAHMRDVAIALVFAVQAQSFMSIYYTRCNTCLNELIYITRYGSTLYIGIA